MAITLDHTIVPAHDKVASAEFFAKLFGLTYGGPMGPFAPVQVNETLTFDFDDRRQGFEVHHYAFHVGEEEFDAIFERIKDAGIAAYGSRVSQTKRSERLALMPTLSKSSPLSVSRHAASNTSLGAATTLAGSRPARATSCQTSSNSTGMIQLAASEARNLRKAGWIRRDGTTGAANCEVRPKVRPRVICESLTSGPPISRRCRAPRSCWESSRACGSDRRRAHRGRCPQ